MIEPKQYFLNKLLDKEKFIEEKDIIKNYASHLFSIGFKEKNKENYDENFDINKKDLYELDYTNEKIEIINDINGNCFPLNEAGEFELKNDKYKILKKRNEKFLTYEEKHTKFLNNYKDNYYTSFTTVTPGINSYETLEGNIELDENGKFNYAYYPSLGLNKFGEKFYIKEVNEIEENKEYLMKLDKDYTSTFKEIDTHYKIMGTVQNNLLHYITTSIGSVSRYSIENLDFDSVFYNTIENEELILNPENINASYYQLDNNFYVTTKEKYKINKRIKSLKDLKDEELVFEDYNDDYPIHQYEENIKKIGKYYFYVLNDIYYEIEKVSNGWNYTFKVCNIIKSDKYYYVPCWISTEPGLGGNFNKQYYDIGQFSYFINEDTCEFVKKDTEEFELLKRLELRNGIYKEIYCKYNIWLNDNVPDMLYYEYFVNRTKYFYNDGIVSFGNLYPVVINEYVPNVKIKSDDSLNLYKIINNNFYLIKIIDDVQYYVKEKLNYYTKNNKYYECFTKYNIPQDINGVKIEYTTELNDDLLYSYNGEKIGVKEYNSFSPIYIEKKYLKIDYLKKILDNNIIYYKLDSNGYIKDNKSYVIYYYYDNYFYLNVKEKENYNKKYNYIYEYIDILYLNGYYKYKNYYFSLKENQNKKIIGLNKNNNFYEYYVYHYKGKVIEEVNNIKDIFQFYLIYFINSNLEKDIMNMDINNYIYIILKPFFEVLSYYLYNIIFSNYTFIYDWLDSAEEDKLYYLLNKIFNQWYYQINCDKIEKEVKDKILNSLYNNMKEFKKYFKPFCKIKSVKDNLELYFCNDKEILKVLQKIIFLYEESYEQILNNNNINKIDNSVIKILNNSINLNLKIKNISILDEDIDINFYIIGKNKETNQRTFYGLKIESQEINIIDLDNFFDIESIGYEGNIEISVEKKEE